MARGKNRSSEEKKAKQKVPDMIGKKVVLDQATWQALDILARDRMMTFQELTDEALLDILRKYNRPYDTRDALKRSARLAQANENRPEKPVSKTKRPAGNRRARS